MIIIELIIEFIARWWLIIAFLIGIGLGWYEHIRFCRERRDGKWWF